MPRRSASARRRIAAAATSSRAQLPRPPSNALAEFLVAGHVRDTRLTETRARRQQRSFRRDHAPENGMPKSPDDILGSVSPALPACDQAAPTAHACLIQCIPQLGFPSTGRPRSRQEGSPPGHHLPKEGGVVTAPFARVGPAARRAGVHGSTYNRAHGVRRDHDARKVRDTTDTPPGPPSAEL